MSLVSGEKSNFQFILRLLNTNVRTTPSSTTRPQQAMAHGAKHHHILTPVQVDGKQKVMYALTKISGVGRRYSNLVCKKADVDLNKRYISPRLSPIQHAH